MNQKIIEAFIDNVVNTPDVEFLQEMKEDYGDASVVANKVRKIIQKSQIVVGRYESKDS